MESKEWISFGEITLLSIEDDSFNQELMSSVFEEIPNIKVLKASNGKEGLEQLGQNDVDIILLDLIMPQMNGFEMLEQIKSTPEYRDIPVIIVTSKEEERRRTYKMGANDFITKPYSPTELKVRVHNLVSLRRFSKIYETLSKDAHSSDIDNDRQIKLIQESIKTADCHANRNLYEKLATLSRGYKSENDAKRLSKYAHLMAKLYGMSNHEAELFACAVSLYDIGLLHIPLNMLEKIETKEYREHPNIGYEILNGMGESELIDMAKVMTLYHHENWDGSGFPLKIKQQKIPLVARLCAVVDYYDELTSKRVYTEEPIKCEEALLVLEREKGRRLDPELTDIFINNFERFKALM